MQKLVFVDGIKDNCNIYAILIFNDNNQLLRIDSLFEEEKEQNNNMSFSKKKITYVPNLQDYYVKQVKDKIELNGEKARKWIEEYLQKHEIYKIALQLLNENNQNIEKKIDGVTYRLLFF